jgi:hypothetical protein
MENNFDIKKFLIENKLTRLSEQDDDWDFEASDEWNLSPEDEELLSHYNGEWELTDEGLILKDDLDLRGTNIQSLGSLKSINGGLDLFDSEIKSLGNLQYVGNWLNLRGTKIESLGNLKFVEGNLHLRETPLARKYTEKEIRQMVNVGGGIYGVEPPLNEQDDEWDFEAGEEWNVTELGIGDHITLDMLNQDNQPHLKHFLAVFEPNTFPLLIDKGNFNNYVVLRPEKGGRGGIWTIKLMNNIFLKPGYQIVPPLNESDDEWDFEAGPEWNETLLSLGDKITPDMWNDNYKTGFIHNDIWIIVGINKGEDEIELEGENEGYFNWNISSIQDYLKPQYKIVENKNLYEQQDDDWDLEADEEWNIKDLTAGDYITPEMLNDTQFTKAWRALNQDIKIVGFKKDPFVRDTLCVVEYIDEWNETRQNDIDIESFNKYFLKPGYRIVAP